MVLTLRRAACVVLIVAMRANPAAAQQRPDTARSGDIRPLLFGFALECIVCAQGEHGRGRGGGQAPAATYRITVPHVIAVAPGSAAEQAGIRPGDMLLSIDGLSVVTKAGEERLTHAKAGQQVRLAFERAGKPVAVSLKLGAVHVPPNGSRANPVYGGYVAMQGGPMQGSVKLEIWSDEPIVMNDPVVQQASSPSTDSAGVMVLRIGTNTIIRLQLTKDSAALSIKRKE